MHTPSMPSRRRSGALSVACAAVLAAAASLVVVTSSAAGRAATGTTASTPRCANSQLVVWLDTQGNGAAGSITYDIELTNLSGHRCTLFGYPGVSAVSL